MARRYCQYPRASMPKISTQASRCQPSQRGEIRNRHRGPSDPVAAVSASTSTPDMPSSLAPRPCGHARGPRETPGRRHTSCMVMASMLPPRWRPVSARMPENLAELRGPRLGVVVLPVHLTWHGLREFDVSDAAGRHLLYTILLSQGNRKDIARFIHPDLLARDWPELSALLTSRVRDACARRFGLGTPA